MRGKGRPGRLRVWLARITPAYAGKSSVCVCVCVCDHPRVCGEKYGTAWRWLMVTGSPPRMRGKVAYTDLQRPSPGITPAYAGKSLLKLLHHVGLRDHPRVCGEKGAPVPNVPVAAGSPPRMRGKVPRNLTDYQTRRITPAYAGKRRALLFQARQYGDHPRVCGEKWVILQKYLAGQGSPPRMRGKGKYRQG